MTQISIRGEEFLIDGVPTHEGRVFEGTSVQGLLFNVRAVQATFDDRNPATRSQWVYPDTGAWDPDRNTSEFCAALPTWRDHGVRSFTLGLQGGGGNYRPEIYDHYENSAFDWDGGLRPDYAARVRRVITRADELGMVAIVSIFYWMQVVKFRDESAVWRAAREAVDFVAGLRVDNVLVEIANETDTGTFGHAVFEPQHAHRMIAELRDRQPGLLYSTSTVLSHSGLPPESLYRAVDFILIHGNGSDPEQLSSGIQGIRALAAYRESPKPILINEDSPAIDNLDASWRNRAGWGYYDQGHGSDLYDELPREADIADLSGFQTPPVNWTINTHHKRAFFDRVARVTGSQPDPSTGPDCRVAM